MKATTETTLPILPSTPPILHTPRLLLRPFSITDLPHYLALRRQPEVMKWTSVGRCDETIAQTEEWMARFLPSENPNTFNFSIEELETPRVVIGAAGVNVLPGKRPEIGYMLRKEVWGRGYASETVGAVLKAYWRLERREVTVELGTEDGELKQGHDGEEVAWRQDGDTPDLQVETLLAVTEVANAASRRILEKFGFVKVREYTDWDAGGTECVEYILERPAVEALWPLTSAFQKKCKSFESTA
jgi:RimJ/RimL family protein N-acetyltransferase